MDIPVLKYVDVLIGLALVMLLVATVALSISQALLNMVRARARHLSWALEGLIRQTHPALLGPHAADMARLVLLHPLVGLPRGPIAGIVDRLLRMAHFSIRGVWRRLPDGLRARVPGWLRHTAKRWLTSPPLASGRVILREELAICLLEWASGDGAWSMTGTGRRAALIQALRERGIEDPAATLKAVRLQALANERDNPDQSAELWRSRALAQCAPSDFLAGLSQAFDNAMARSTTSFGMEAQMWVSMIALALVFALQLDAIQLVRRLSMDEAYRQTLVQDAKKLTEQLEKECPEPAPGTNSTCDPKNAEQVAKIVARIKGVDCDTATLTAADLEKCRINASVAILQEPALDLWPGGSAGAPPLANRATATAPPDRGEPGWIVWLFESSVRPDRWLYPAWRWLVSIKAKIPGILVAWILVSLGAPFWYDLLKNLFKLRSLLAQKDDADRDARNTGAPPPAATVTVTRPGAVNEGQRAEAPATPAQPRRRQAHRPPMTARWATSRPRARSGRPTLSGEPA